MTTPSKIEIFYFGKLDSAPFDVEQLLQVPARCQLGTRLEAQRKFLHLKTIAKENKYKSNAPQKVEVDEHTCDLCEVASEKQEQANLISKC